MNDLKVEYLPLSAIKPYERNARKHADTDVAAIVASIREFGFDDPIGIWGKENLIVEGHGRLLAAKKLGLESVPCIRLDHLTDEQRRAYALAHNKTAELSGWDFGLLDLELGDIELDMSAFGFDLGEEEEEPREAVEDDYDPEPPKEPKAKRGDIYQLGRHRLMCGDSTMIDDVQTLVGGVLVDLLLTDPPYNVALGMGGSVDDARKRHRRTDGLVIMNDKMGNDDFRRFLTDVFSNAKIVMKGGAAFYVWHADNEGYNFRGALQDAGLSLRQTLIWAKNSITLGRQDYQWKHEPCLYGWNEGASHSWYSDRKQTTILNFDKPVKSAEHPTMKPVPLFDYQIKNSTKAGDIVLDLFGGRGTTMIACEQNGRSAYLMELDPRYVDVIIDRWEKFTGEKAVLLNRAE